MKGKKKMYWAVLGALRHGLLQCCLTLQTWLSSSCLLCVLVALSCPTLCDPMRCSLSGSSFHGILQARILEWIAMPSSKGFSWLRDQTLVSCTAGRFFTTWANREVLLLLVTFFQILKVQHLATDEHSMTLMLRLWALNHFSFSPIFLSLVS